MWNTNVPPPFFSAAVLRLSSGSCRLSARLPAALADSLKREGALELYRICSGFVDGLNGRLEKRLHEDLRLLVLGRGIVPGANIETDDREVVLLIADLEDPPDPGERSP